MLGESAQWILSLCEDSIIERSVSPDEQCSLNHYNRAMLTQPLQPSDTHSTSQHSPMEGVQGEGWFENKIQDCIHG